MRRADRVARAPRAWRARCARRSASSSSTRPLKRFRWSLPFTFSTFDYRELCALLWAQCGEARFETATVAGRSAGDGGTIVVHTDRGDVHAPLVVDALGWRRVLSTSAHADPAAERPPLARPGGPSARHRRRPRDLARPALHPPRLLVELPGRRRAARRRRLVRPAAPRQGPDGRARRRPRPARRGLPGQLDPAPDARPGRGRRLLRRRQRRPLPAGDRRGHPPRVLLRPRLRARAARGARPAPARASRRSSATPRSARTSATPGAGCCACSTSSGASTPTRR